MTERAAMSIACVAREGGDLSPARHIPKTRKAATAGAPRTLRGCRMMTPMNLSGAVLHRGLKATSSVQVSTSQLLISLPSSVLQVLTVRCCSWPAANVWPSGLNAAIEVLGLAFTVRIFSPVLASQRLISLPAAVSTWLPSGLKIAV